MRILEHPCRSWTLPAYTVGCRLQALLRMIRLHRNSIQQVFLNSVSKLSSSVMKKYLMLNVVECTRFNENNHYASVSYLEKKIQSEILAVLQADVGEHIE